MVSSHSYANLTPLTFLERSGLCFAQRSAVVLEGKSICFGELLKRARRMVSVLHSLGVGHGDRVGLLAHNSLQSIEAHYAIPGAGGIVTSFNPWLPGVDILKQIKYSGARTILVSNSLLSYHKELFLKVPVDLAIVVLGADSKVANVPKGCFNFEADQFSYDSSVSLEASVRSENDPIALNFTSGTTGEPKGVVYTHRAAYLNALGQALMLKLSASSAYYWSLPMFHVNGWGHMWATVAVGAKQIVDDSFADIHSKIVLERLVAARITHMAGAPRLLRYLAEEARNSSRLKGLTILTGGAAPTPDLIISMRQLGVNLIHQYGLNETCGPYVVCEDMDEWADLSEIDQVKKRLRQGIAAIHAGTGLRVVDQNMNDVSWDGLCQGEVIMSGNTVAQTYFNNPSATDIAFKDGSGDVAVVHPDGYLEIKDRLKDLIFVETEYGWENISSIEIENALSQYSDITDVAVVCVRGDEEDTQIVAFYEKIPGSSVDNEMLAEFCSIQLPHLKVPNHFLETLLPKTATGKVKKALLEMEARRRISR